MGTTFERDVIERLTAIESKQDSQVRLCRERMCHQGTDIKALQDEVFGTDAKPGLKLDVDRLKGTTKRGRAADIGSGAAAGGLTVYHLWEWLASFFR